MSTPLRYHEGGERIHLIPWNMHDPELEPYTRALSRSLQQDCDRVFAVVRVIHYIVDGASYDTRQLVRGYLSTIGFSASSESRHGGVSLLGFEKAKP